MNMNAGYLKRDYRVKIGFIMNFQLIEGFRFWGCTLRFFMAGSNKALTLLRKAR